MSVNIGDKIPEFELFNYDKTKYSNEDFLGQKTMFVFKKISCLRYESYALSPHLYL